ncbi:MAG: hypothetical protein WAX89_04915 [Alphaproteobacteria bacterium]
MELLRNFLWASHSENYAWLVMSLPLMLTCGWLVWQNISTAVEEERQPSLFWGVLFMFEALIGLADLGNHTLDHSPPRMNNYAYLSMIVGLTYFALVGRLLLWELPRLAFKAPRSLFAMVAAGAVYGAALPVLSQCLMTDCFYLWRDGFEAVVFYGGDTKFFHAKLYVLYPWFWQHSYLPQATYAITFWAIIGAMVWWWRHARKGAQTA